MLRKFSKKWLILSTVLVLAVVAGTGVINYSHSSIDFNAQVKPIFNKKCITCHGGVKRQSGFSLLFRSEALAKNESGLPAIIPGHPEKSEMIRRLGLKDPEERMPYKHEPLKEEEINILKRWIKEGAQWGDHWAYVEVKPVELPKPKGSFFGLIAADKPQWVRNDIDYFIYDGLQKDKLQPSPQADKATLLRRVSLDLTGLPPSSSLTRQFLQRNDSMAYEDLVDSLLASPRYGERWTALWMDIARYSDTKGYESDYERKGMWKYRDWLIKAFNEDKPYNVFLTEQIAGDMLPNPTDAQYIATAFQRNTLTNDEGGTDNEEFRTAAVLDRVNSTWEGLMGTTFACVQCHSHPYDPFTHDEYYKFVGFFNNTRDEDTPDDYPLLRQFDTAYDLKLKRLSAWVAGTSGLAKEKEVYNFVKTWQPSINSIICDTFFNGSLEDNKYAGLRNEGYCRYRKVKLDQKNSLIVRYYSSKKGSRFTVRMDKPDGPVLLSGPIPFTHGEWKIDELKFNAAAGTHDLYAFYENPDRSDPLTTGLGLDWLYFSDSFPGQGQPGYANALKDFWSLLNAPAITTPIMIASAPDYMRTTNVFDRGNWMAKGKVVQPDVPHSLNPLPANAPHNRLGMAMWLTDKKNPLTSRTMVNRLWEQLFGTGIVETLEDMGTQGIPPSNKELLDRLSWKFMNEYNWSIKKLLKELVMSATYRQDSKSTKELLEKDPYNKLYARGPRVRLAAEQVRDQALAVCGLLNTKMYGPSVMPWQPQGIWSFAYNGAVWKKDVNEDQYRRGVYTFWKRTAPYPSMIAFDGSARISCTPRRIRSNTPLQALVTLNDSVYIEAARYFARRMQQDGGAGVKEQVNKGYELVMYKPISPLKLAALEKLYQVSLEKYKKDVNGTAAMTGADVHDTTDRQKYNNPETAALTVVANAILNLDEVITKN